MKKILLITGIALSVNGFGQVKDLMLKKAGGILNNKKETSASKDSTQTNQTENKEESGGMFNMKMGSKSDVQAEYSFSSNVYVQIQNYKKNGEKDGDASNVRYHFSNEDYFGTEMIMTDKKGNTTESIGISEFKKSQMISLITSDGDKTGTVMKVDLQKAAEKSKDTSDIKITKTGRSKKVLGYTCEEYIMTDKDGNKTEYWNTSELKYDMSKMFAGDRSGNQPKNYESGFMMEMTYLDKDGKKTTWNVLEVNPSATKTIKTGDYNFPF
jgi:hypothetical protein